MGYTTAFDAAIPPLAARHAQWRNSKTPPAWTRGFYVLMGNNHYVMRSIQENEPQKLKAFIGWLLSAAKGFAPKTRQTPAVWSRSGRAMRAENVSGLDQQVDHF